MNKTISRRDALGWLGGLTVGAFLSPAPWKLLDDLAIRTQNEGWVAHPQRGRRHVVNTRCTACSRGCALSVTCVDDRPVAVLPRSVDPRGGFCALGAVVHHWSAHPRRAEGARWAETGRAVDLSLASAMIHTWIGEATRNGGTPVLLQAQPERPEARALRRTLAPLGVVACAAPSLGEDLRRLGALGSPAETLRWDLSSVDRVLVVGGPLEPVFGAELADGAEVVAASTMPALRPVPRQRWMPLAPGSEDALVLALLARLDEAHPVSTAALDAATHLGTGELDALARWLRRGRAVAMPAHDPGSAGPAPTRLALLARLNAVIGAFEYALVPGVELPWPWLEAPTPLHSVHDLTPGSMPLLLVDTAGAEAELGVHSLLRRCGTPRTRVVVLTSFDGDLARRADLRLAVRGPLETRSGLPTGPTAGHGDFAVARALRAPDEDCFDRLELARAIVERTPGARPANTPCDEDEALALQVAALASTPGAHLRDARGSTSIVGAEELLRALEDGAVWEGPRPEASARTPREFPVPDDPRAAIEAARPRPGQWPLVPGGPAVVAAGFPLPPLFSKLARESDLLPREGEVWAHPESAESAGWFEGARLRLTREGATAERTLRLSSDLPAGRLFAPRGLAKGCFGDESSSEPGSSSLLEEAGWVHVEEV